MTFTELLAWLGLLTLDKPTESEPTLNHAWLRGWPTCPVGRFSEVGFRDAPATFLLDMDDGRPAVYWWHSHTIIAGVRRHSYQLSSLQDARQLPTLIWLLET